MKRRTILISLATGAALAATGISLAEALTPPVVSQTEIASARRAFEAAMNLRQSVTSANVPVSTRHLTKVQLAAMVTSGTAQLDRSFKDEALKAELKAVAQAQSMNASDQFRSGGGSADHFRYTRNKGIDSQHVSLAGSYTARSTVYVPGKDGKLVRADPTGVLDFTAQMQRDAATGQWMVASFAWDFAPGSEP